MARRKIDKLTQALADAKASGAYMVAVWEVKDGKVNLFRQTESFPVSDVSIALDMLAKDLKPITIQKGEDE